MNNTNLSDNAYINKSLLVETDKNKYLLAEPVSKKAMYQLMLNLLEEKYFRTDQLTSPDKVREYLQVKLAQYEQEVFCCIYLDNQHQVIAFEELFYGTIDNAFVHPREVLKQCLHHNAAAVIFAHNHPSGIPEPSSSDINITKRLKEALNLVDIRILDHIIVGGTNTTSFAEIGLI